MAEPPPDHSSNSNSQHHLHLRSGQASQAATLAQASQPVTSSFDNTLSVPTRGGLSAGSVHIQHHTGAVHGIAEELSQRQSRAAQSMQPTQPSQTTGAAPVERRSPRLIEQGMQAVDDVEITERAARREVRLHSHCHTRGADLSTNRGRKVQTKRGNGELS